MHISFGYMDWCGSCLWVADGLLLVGYFIHSHTSTLSNRLLRFALRFASCHVLQFALHFGTGGVRSAYVYVYVPTQPQKKVILDLFQVLDLFNILMTVLH